MINLVKICKEQTIQNKTYCGSGSVSDKKDGEDDFQNGRDFTKHEAIDIIQLLE